MKANHSLAAAAAFVSVALAGCAQHVEPVARKPIPVRAQEVRAGARDVLTRFSGSLEASTRVDMAFRVGGYVEAVAIEQGDFVKKGSMLARLRSSDYAQKVATARAAVAEARAQAKLAGTELERARKLYASKTITKADFDTLQARSESAEASVAGAVARVAEAEVARADTTLRAPMDGVVLARSVEVGGLVSPGAPAIAMADTRTVNAKFGVPQALVETLELGMPLEVHVGAEGEAGAGPTLAARITKIAPSADGSGRVFSVEAELPNEGGALRVGSVVSVHMVSAQPERAALSVPLSAVVRAPNDANGFAVFVLPGDKPEALAKLTTVELGHVRGNAVTVTAGLSEHARVVTTGAPLLRDGSAAIAIP